MKHANISTVIAARLHDYALSLNRPWVDNQSYMTFGISYHTSYVALLSTTYNPIAPASPPLEASPLYLDHASLPISCRRGSNCRALRGSRRIRHLPCHPWSLCSRPLLGAHRQQGAVPLAAHCCRVTHTRSPRVFASHWQSSLLQTFSIASVNEFLGGCCRIRERQLEGMNRPNHVLSGNQTTKHFSSSRTSSPHNFTCDMLSITTP